MDLFSELNSLMIKYRFRPEKKLGQSFIIDSTIIEKAIEEAEITKRDTVLEIGPGPGFLTREIQKKCRVIAIELDETLFGLLQEELPKKNLTLIHSNFLKSDLPFFNKIISFPPYNISSAIMQKLFSIDFALAVFSFQKEFGEKLLALPGFKEYNALSVLTQYHFKVKKVQLILGSSFFPKPPGPSVLVKLHKKNLFGKAKREELFHLFIKSIFRYQNKNLKNALINAFPFIQKKVTLDKKEFFKKISEIKLANKKVNLIHCKEFVELFNQLF